MRPCTSQDLNNPTASKAFASKLSARPNILRRELTRPSVAKGSEQYELSDSTKKDIYNKEMAEKMGWESRPYEYHFERGLYYHEIIPNLICGSQPTGPHDIQYLKESEGVDSIVCVRFPGRVCVTKTGKGVGVQLQQRHDAIYWKVDPDALEHAARKQDLFYVRKQMVDFDKGSLRAALPDAVQCIVGQIDLGKRVYVHCTAGLGRAPATCIAYLYWFHEHTLDSAYEHLTSLRPCGPNKDAVRGATYDLLSGGDWDAFAALPQHAYTSLEPEDRYALQYRVLRG